MTKDNKMPDEIWMDPENCMYSLGEGVKNGKPRCVKYTRTTSLIAALEGMRAIPCDHNLTVGQHEGRNMLIDEITKLLEEGFKDE